MTVKIVSENGTEIFGSLSEIERRDCLLRGTSGHNEKVALNFCGGIVSVVGGKVLSETDDYDYQRGVLTSHLDYYVINPLSPGRVRRSGDTAQPHVIFRSDLNTLFNLHKVNIP